MPTLSFRIDVLASYCRDVTARLPGDVMRAVVLAAAIVTVLLPNNAQAQSERITQVTAGPNRASGPRKTRQVVIDLGTLYAGGSTEPRAINERGTVVGVARQPDGSETAFMWSRAQGLVALVDNAVATDVNNRGGSGWMGERLQLRVSLSWFHLER